MWCELEHAIKDQVSTLEKDITPVPTIIFHDAVCFGFDPEIEHDQRHTANPATHQGVNGEIKVSLTNTHRMT